MHINFKNKVSRDDLHQLYVIDQKSISQIAKLFDTTSTTIRRTLDQYNIPKRLNSRDKKKDDFSKRNKLTKKVGSKGGIGSTLTKERLTELYVKQKLSAVEIAKLYNINSTNVYRLLKIYNIKVGIVPFYEKIGKDILSQLYLIEMLEAPNIAQLYNVDSQQVLYALKHYDIPIRNVAEIRRNKFTSVYPHLDISFWHKFRQSDWWDAQLKLMPVQELADSLHVRYGTVIEWLTYHNIQASSYGWNDTWGEREIARWLDEFEIKYVRNDTSIIAPRHLDFYIPSHKLAIEVNGEYWHSDQHQRMSRSYHQSKTHECSAKGVRLIQIWHSDLKDTRTNRILKSKVLNALMLRSVKVFARKTEIVEVSASVYRQFYDDNHIQGGPQYYKINYALLYGTDIVAIISFNKRSDGSLYLARYATKLDYVVVGGFSKLLQHTIRTHNPSFIETYSNGQYHQEPNVYERCGFEKQYWTEPNYFYYKPGSVSVSRQSAQRSKLHTLLSNYDSTISEYENMTNNGYYRIYDCGHVKYTLTIA